MTHGTELMAVQRNCPCAYCAAYRRKSTAVPLMAGDLTERAHTAAEMLPDGYEMTPERARLLDMLCHPAGSSALAHYGDGLLDAEFDLGDDPDDDAVRRNLMAGLNAEFPTSSELAEDYDFLNVVQALNERRGFGTREQEIYASFRADEDGLIMDVGVWLQGGHYLTTPMHVNDLLPGDGEGRNGLAAAITVAENFEAAHARMVSSAKEYGLLTANGDSTLSWEYAADTQTEPVSLDEALARMDEHGRFTSVVSVNSEDMIGKDYDALYAQLARAQFGDDVDPSDVSFEIVKMDAARGIFDVKVSSDISEYAG